MKLRGKMQARETGAKKDKSNQTKNKECDKQEGMFGKCKEEKVQISEFKCSEEKSKAVRKIKYRHLKNLLK